MFFRIILIANLLLVATKSNSDTGYCDIGAKTCNDISNDKFLLFYDVNPPEGFNLRRDVYMRFAIMLAEKRKIAEKNIKLVLPPWYRLYHWKTEVGRAKPLPWRTFFDLDSLKTFAPVAELYEIFDKTGKILQIDTLYILQNYENAFEDGVFIDKWEISEKDCHYDGYYWGYNNITAKEIVCVKFQGKISMLWEIIGLHPKDNSVMFAHGEIPLHDSYGTKTYWDCRKSIKFNKNLVEAAEKFISKNLDCNTVKCNSYISVHWRRQDFEWSQKVPSITSTVKQIDNAIKKYKPKIEKVFVASDANESDLRELENQLKRLGYGVYFFLPNKTEMDNYKEGGVAIIDQIICSRSAYFIGTHESTFSFRIQEEREILKFDSSTTFNRLCPDKGYCEKPSKWTIVD